MLRCLAGGLTRAHIEVWFGEHGTGYLSLFQRKNDQIIHLGDNPSAGDALKFALPPESAVVLLGIRVFNADIQGQARPVFLEVKQNGTSLQIVDETTGDSQNGEDPYRELELSPPAPHNEPKFYYFSVSFA